MTLHCPDCARGVRARHLGAFYASGVSKRRVRRGYAHLVDQIPGAPRAQERKRAIAKAFRAGRAEEIHERCRDRAEELPQALPARAAAQLHLLRRAAGVAAEKMGAELGITYQSYLNRENPRGNMTLKSLESAAAELGYRVEVRFMKEDT